VLTTVVTHHPRDKLPVPFLDIPEPVGCGNLHPILYRQVCLPVEPISDFVNEARSSVVVIDEQAKSP
jgi:hypothetical protein